MSRKRGNWAGLVNALCALEPTTEDGYAERVQQEPVIADVIARSTARIEASRALKEQSAILIEESATLIDRSNRLRSALTTPRSRTA